MEDKREQYLEYLRRIAEGDDYNDESALNGVLPFDVWNRWNKCL